MSSPSIAIWCITKHGIDIGRRLHAAFPEATFFVPKKFADKTDWPATHYDELLSKVIEREFHEHDQHIFVISLGAVIRMIAPFLKNKKVDPGVVVVDDASRHAISALSGHVGGANAFTEEVARALDAAPVVTTASDVGNTIPVDILGREFGWIIDDDHAVTPVSAAVVNEEPVAFVQECGERNWWNRSTPLPASITLFDSLDAIPDRASFNAFLIVSDRLLDNDIADIHDRSVVYRPKTLHIGTGCNTETPLTEIEDAFNETLTSAELSVKSLKDFSSIERKADEPCYRELSDSWNIPFCLFSKDQLNTLTDLPNPSEVVKKFVGSPGVAEPAAMLAAQNEELLVTKQKFANCTVAIARKQFDEATTTIKPGRIYIVGAGPGAPDLITLRGRDLLEAADLVVFAGSLVPRQLMDNCKPDCHKVDSKGLDLEQITEKLTEAARAGQVVVRLHTGEPSIFGATLEQCDIFKAEGVPFEIIPGISSFQAAAAVLKAEFTIPEVSQTLVISRAAGRTPVPEKEELVEIGKLGATICLYLSAGLAQKVQDDLLQCYPPDTPTAIAYRVSWPDEKIMRCKLEDLVTTVERHKIKMHALIIVGPGLVSHGTKSRLYAADFSHRFRKAKKES